jgi:hypothetical protein
MSLDYAAIFFQYALRNSSPPISGQRSQDRLESSSNASLSQSIQLHRRRIRSTRCSAQDHKGWDQEMGGEKRDPPLHTTLQ